MSSESTARSEKNHNRVEGQETRVYSIIAQLLIKTNAYKFIPDTRPQFSYYPLHKYLATINEIPHHVLITYSNLYCSGSLIRSRVVATVASCMAKRSNQRIVVKVGANSITGVGQVIEVLEVKMHEYFGHTSFLDNDIALLMLKEHVIHGPNVQKVILIEPDVVLQEGTMLDVSGWGCLEHAPKYANSLLWSEMVVLNDGECIKSYPILKSASNFCVRYTPDRRLSDNGGPAVYRELLVGLLSYGTSNIEEPYVAVITNVSYFRRWITLNTMRLMTKHCLRSETTKNSE